MSQENDPHMRCSSIKTNFLSHHLCVQANSLVIAPVM